MKLFGEYKLVQTVHPLKKIDHTLLQSICDTKPTTHLITEGIK